MRLIIGLSAIPVIITGAMTVLHNYRELMADSAERAAAAVSRFDLRFHHDTDRLRTTLETIGNVGLSLPQMQRALSLVETMSGNRYCFLGGFDSHQVALYTVTPPERSCSKIIEVSPLKAHNGIDRETIQYAGETGKQNFFLRITVPFFFSSESNEQGYLVGVLRLSRKSDELISSPEWEGFSGNNNLFRAWVIGTNVDLEAVCTDCKWPDPDPSVVKTLLARYKNRPEDITSLSDLSGGYALRFIAGKKNGILVMTPRTSAETRSLSVMVLQIIGIVLLFVIGLSCVTLAANIVLVSPLHVLTRAVEKWQSEGVFDARITSSMPVELQHLGQAFTKVTRRLNKNEAILKKAMAHQDLLMKEIHHRVKNNLQIVASLLNLQAGRVSSPLVKAEFSIARDRVRTLATLHRNLYAKDTLERLDIAVFLRELCSQTLEVTGGDDNSRVGIDIIADSFYINSDQAVPLALIVTELVTNSAKYAFPDGRHGLIVVRVSKNNRIVTLEVSDNGVGYIQNQEPTYQGIGLKLIKGLARQLNAEFKQSCQNGTSYIFTFALDGEN